MVDHSSLTGDLQEAEERLQAAMLAGDVPALDRLLDDRVVYTDPDGQCVTKQDDLQAHRSGTLTLDRITQEDLAVTVAGNADAAPRPDSTRACAQCSSNTCSWAAVG